VAQAVDERDHAGGAVEDLVPLGEALVRGDDEGATRFVALAHDLVQEVGVTSVVAQVAYLVDREELGVSVALQAIFAGGAIDRGEVVEHRRCGDEAHGVAACDRLVGEVLGDHGLADSVGTNDDDVVELVDEREVEEALHLATVDLRRVLPVEVGDRLEGADLGGLDTVFLAAASSLDRFELDELGDPGLLAQLVPTRQHAIQTQLDRSAAEFFEVRRWFLHRRPH
jgi:hypothetical protein